MKFNTESMRILDILPIFISINDRSHKIIWTNKHLLDFFKLKKEDYVGKTLMEVFPIEGERYIKQNNKIFNGGNPMLGLVEEVVFYGDSFWSQTDKIPIINEKTKEIEHIIVFVRDVTQKKKYEEDLIRTQNLESIGLLSGGIAHDFNNFLTGILGNISLAELTTDNIDLLMQYLAEAKKSIINARDLTQQLLTFSKGGAPLKKLTISSRFSDNLMQTTNFIIRGSSVKSHFEIDDDLWPVEVDQGQFSRVINNIAINAVQAMLKGGTLKIYAKNYIYAENINKIIKSGYYIEIKFIDEGIGIRPEDLDKLFRPYFTTKESGSGLGLATSYSIIKRHKGYIFVSSALGIGTTFRILLPAKPDATKITIESSSEIQYGTGNILIMDDDDSVLKVLSASLEKLGYQTDIVNDGKEAIKAYLSKMTQQETFDLVIMDLTIPGGMGGKNAVQEIHKIDPNAKVIVTSGYSKDPVIANYKEYGFIGVILKPYGIEELSIEIKKAITQ